MLQDHEEGPVGLLEWSCARSMAAFASTCVPRGYWKGKRVLEVGSGVGTVAAHLASLGAHVVASDTPTQPSVVQTLRQNLSHSGVQVAELQWLRSSCAEPCDPPPATFTDAHGPFDHLVLCDALYNSKDTFGVLATVAALLRASAEAGAANPSAICFVEGRSANRCIAPTVRAVGLQATVLSAPLVPAIPANPASAPEAVGLVLLSLGGGELAASSGGAQS